MVITSTEAIDSQYIFPKEALMSQRQIKNLQPVLPAHPEFSVAHTSHPFIQQKVQGNVRNRKWSQQEHVLYILFLEFNRNKIKSKLIRRSNSFYKEMAAFVKGKNPIQCRSHHQKYEARYKYPHKIIKEEKERLDQHLYSSILATIQLPATPSSTSIMADMELKFQEIKVQKDSSSFKTVGCQTDIYGVDQTFVKPEQLYAYYSWINQMGAIQHGRQAEWMFNYCIPREYYPMGYLMPHHHL